MARGIHKLATAKVKNAKPGLHSDGGCLYLQSTVGKEGNVRRSWIFRYELDGRRRDMGLGSLDTISLAQARERARQHRERLIDGIDPLEHRKSRQSESNAEAAALMTFDQAAAAYIAAHESGWHNIKHAAQWRSTLKTYVSPAIGKLSVLAIDVEHIRKILEPIWTKKHETARRVRMRIESVLGYAYTVKKQKDRQNPARWRGHLENLLAKRSKADKVKHFPALPYEQVGSFAAALREREGIGALAFEFAILTASRTGEVRAATLDEIDLKNRLWTVPAERMKAGRKHQVPLSDAAMAVLHKVREITRKIGGNVGRSEFVFPNDRNGDGLSENVFIATLDRMKRRDITPHGFRSTFKDWASECTAFPNEATEMALAHAVGDKVEAAYRRGDLFEKRRKIMTAWAKYCSEPSRESGAVIPMRARETR